MSLCRHTDGAINCHFPLQLIFNTFRLLFCDRLYNNKTINLKRLVYYLSMLRKPLDFYQWLMDVICFFIRGNLFFYDFFLLMRVFSAALAAAFVLIIIANILCAASKVCHLDLHAKVTLTMCETCNAF